MSDIGIKVAKHLVTVADELRAKVADLQAFVDKLPKTADGVAITPGMTVYVLFDAGVIEEHVADAVRRFRIDFKTMGYQGYLGARSNCCYVTREAAE